MITELETLAQFDAHVAGRRDLRGCFVQSLDLRARTDLLASVPAAGAVFLGCRMSRVAEDHLRSAGALIFPRIPDLPMNPYRSTLYNPAELYKGLSHGYADTPDGRIYRWYGPPPHDDDLGRTFAMAIHDHSMDDAVAEAVRDHDPRVTVGVMGGHALKRGSDGYAQAASLGQRLAAAGRLVITGGGPGAMEAANMGAWFAADSDRLAEVCGLLAAVPDFHESIDKWASVGFQVRTLATDPGFSLGIPTWFYGHEPPNVFASLIAKYFNNARREEVLLQRCQGGIVYLPGAAGTVQEVFQAVTGNYYAASAATITPLVLLGRRYWTEQVPAWPLLESLAQGRLMQPHIHLVDSVTEALSALGM